MKNPSDIETDKRSEMICPICFEKSLEQDSRHKEYDKKRAKLFYATRCGNDDCEKGRLTDDEVKKQYSKPSFIDNVKKNASITEVVLLVGVLVGAVVFLSTGGIPFISEDTGGGNGTEGPGGGTGSAIQATGQIVTEEDLDDITVSINNETKEVNSNGRFSIIREPGEYTVRVERNGEYAVDVIPIILDEEETISINTNNIYDRSDYTVSDDTLIIQRNRLRSTEIQQVVQDTEYTHEVNSLENTDSISVRVEPVLTENPESSVDLSQTEQVFIPETTTSKSIDIESSIKQTEREVTKSFNGEKQELTVGGNLDPSNVEVDISRKGGEPIEERNLYFDSNSQSDTFNVISQNPTDFELTVESAGRQNINTYTGETEDGTHTQSITPSEDNVAEISIEGSESENSETIQGVVESSEIRTDYEGTTAPENPEISFTDGDVVTREVGSRLLSANADQGFSEEEIELIENATAGTYRINLNTSIGRNEDLTAVGYAINGSRTEIDADRTTVDVELEQDDSLSIFVEATQENLPEGDFTSNEEITIEKVDVQSTELRAGGSTGVRYLATNPTNRDIRYTAYLYKDGEQVESKTTVIPSGAFEYTISFDSRIQFDEEGTHSISVNTAPPVGVVVGDAELQTGKISSQITVSQIEEESEIRVDTNNDGTYDCTTNIGDSCELQPDSVSTTVPIELENVSNVEYTISYDSIANPQNLFIDTNSDDEPEYEYFGPVSDSIETTLNIPSTANEITVYSGNERNFTYDITVFEKTEVVDPVLYTNGVEQQTLESFTDTTTFSLDDLPSNEYEMEIRNENDTPIEGTISWRTRGETSYPDTIINGETVCEGVSECDVQNLQTGTNEIMFDGWKSLAFDYTVRYTEQQVAESVNINVNGETQKIVRNVGTTTENGTWKTTTSANFIPVGTNRISLSASGSNVTGTANFQFEPKDAENPKILLNNSVLEEPQVYTVNDNSTVNGILSEADSVVIPKEDLATGENIIQFTSDNSGIYRVQFEAETDI